MDAHTALTFVLVQQYLTPLLPRSTLSHLDAHFRLATTVLQESVSGPLRHWPEKIRVVPNGQRLAPAKIQPEVLESVYDALLQGLCLKVDYCPRTTGERRHYDVNPLGIVLRNSVTYLVCTLWNYDDIKLLALHRMRMAKTTDRPVSVPAHFRIDEYIQSGAFGFPGDEKPIRKIRLKALFDADAARHLYECSISDDQKLTERGDGRILLEATVLNTGELQWWLQGFGDLVEVVAPKRLRQSFAESALRQARLYHSGVDA
ncbi:MAG TPA: WYL domain-containing protein [Gammaproteobacteria bacterium]|nr:WYL domain-containing protein [Gammaproteobacteria bacterium]